MDYPVVLPGQLSSHLRALRKSRGLTQQQLGALLGVGQTRVARIERDPASISVEQLMTVLGHLGVQVVLRDQADRYPVGSSPPLGMGEPDDAW